MSISNLFVPNDLTLYCGTLNQTTYYRIDYNNIGQTIPNATVTAVQFPLSYISTNNFSAPTINNTIYNVPIQGLYNICYSITYPSFQQGIGIFNSWISTSTTPSSAGTCSISSFEAGSLTPGPPVSNITLGSDVVQLTGSAILYLNPSNNVSIMTYQNSGISLTTATSDSTSITINFLHS
jgi:hypothetical protein